MAFLDVFDSGAFHNKQHGINTVNAEPVKQYERLPGYFRGKRRPFGVNLGTCTDPEERWIPGDGSVRCIDYRALDEVTV